MLRDQARARAVPTADLHLRHCPSCDLVHNSAFRADLMRYHDPYNGSQAASPTFGAFQQALAQRAAAHFGLDAGSRVVDIGAGKGEFLAALADRTGCEGVGIDPAPASDPHPRVRMIAEALHDRHASLGADLVVCRHTLEHILAVRPFLGRLTATARPGAGVLIEVPAVERILAESAFWDIYHEHATTWSARALARAAAAAGIAVEALEPVYDGQYLLLLGRVGGSSARPLPEGGLDWSGFAASVEASITRWRASIDAWSAAGPWGVWGAGSKAVAFLHAVGGAPAAVVDLNAERQGSYLPVLGLPVDAPHRLSSLGPPHVLAMNPIYRQEIAGALRDLAPDATLHCLGDAP